MLLEYDFRAASAGVPGLRGIGAAMQQRNYAQETFEFVELLETLGGADDVVTQLEKSLGRFGFETFIVTAPQAPHQRADRAVLASKWPKDWFDIYLEENYIAVDPVARCSRSSVHPFGWREAAYDPVAEPRAREVMDRAADFRMADGFCIPIHGPDGYRACVSMGGVDLDLSPRAKPAIRIMGTYAYEHIRRLAAPARQARHETLTEREREVLTWTALGKTSSEVAEILNLSKRTVDEYCVRASRKLRVQNKTHAVVKALQLKLISV